MASVREREKKSRHWTAQEWNVCAKWNRMESKWFPERQVVHRGPMELNSCNRNQFVSLVEQWKGTRFEQICAWKRERLSLKEKMKTVTTKCIDEKSPRKIVWCLRENLLLRSVPHGDSMHKNHFVISFPLSLFSPLLFCFLLIKDNIKIAPNFRKTKAYHTYKRQPINWSDMYIHVSDSSENDVTFVFYWAGAETSQFPEDVKIDLLMKTSVEGKKSSKKPFRQNDTEKL